MNDRYRRFVRALAFTGAAATLGGCGVGGTGGSCNLSGQSCVVGSADPTGHPCCRCYGNSPSIDAGEDAESNDAAATGTYQTYCVGPLSPPEQAV